MISHRSARESTSHWGTEWVSVARPVGLLPFFFFFGFFPCFDFFPFVWAVSSRLLAPQPCRTSLPVELSGSETDFFFPALALTPSGSVRAGPPPNPRTARTSFRFLDELTTTETFPEESRAWSL